MENNSNEHLIQARIADKFDRLVLIGASIAGLSSVAIYLSGFETQFVFIDLFAALFLLGIYLLRHLIPVVGKIVIVAVVPMVIGILTFVEGGFGSGTMTLFILGNCISIFFLSRRQSIAFSAGTIGIYLGLWLGTNRLSLMTPHQQEPVVWFVHLLMLLMCLALFGISIDVIHNYLFENITRLKEAGALTHKLAYFDQLTGLPNRYKFLDDLNQHQGSSKVEGYIILINISNLSLIRSIYGEGIGDKLLVASTHFLQSFSKEGELYARISEDIFALWIPEPKVNRMLDRLKDIKYTFEQMDVLPDVRRRLTFLASYAKLEGEGADKCFKNAQMALTYTRHHGKHEIFAYDKSFEETLRSQEQLKGELQKAIADASIDLHYQVQVDTKKKSVVGVEALARWESSTGNVPPYVFVPLTEEMGLSVSFGRLTLELAFKDYASISQLYGSDVKLAINISPTFLMSPEFPGYVFRTADHYQIKPENIILEITEEVIIKGIDHVNAVLEPMRQCGYHISLDDFGSGYSSLNYLTQIAVDELKIDRSFIKEIDENQRTYKLVEAIFDLSQSHDLTTVAEGVETVEQLDLLTSMGCRVIQGYYYGRPQALGELKNPLLSRAKG